MFKQGQDSEVKFSWLRRDLLPALADSLPGGEGEGEGEVEGGGEEVVGMSVSDREALIALGLGEEDLEKKSDDETPSDTTPTKSSEDSSEEVGPEAESVTDEDEEEEEEEEEEEDSDDIKALKEQVDTLSEQLKQALVLIQKQQEQASSPAEEEKPLVLEDQTFVTEEEFDNVLTSAEGLNKPINAAVKQAVAMARKLVLEEVGPMIYRIASDTATNRVYANEFWKSHPHLIEKKEEVTSFSDDLARKHENLDIEGFYKLLAKEVSKKFPAPKVSSKPAPKTVVRNSVKPATAGKISDDQQSLLDLGMSRRDLGL